MIAEAVSQRHASGNERDLNILLCVNALGAPAKVVSYIEGELAEEHLAYFREHVAFARSWFSLPAFRATQTPTPGR